MVGAANGVKATHRYMQRDTTKSKWRNWSFGIASLMGGAIIFGMWMRARNHGEAGIVEPVAASSAGPKQTGPRAGGTEGLRGDVANWEKLKRQSTEERTTDRARATLLRIFRADAQQAFKLIEEEDDYEMRRILLISLLGDADAEQCELIMRKAGELIAGGDLGAVYEKGLGLLTKASPQRSVALWRSLPSSTAKSISVSAIVEAWPQETDKGELWRFYEEMELPEEQGQFKRGMEALLLRVPIEEIENVRQSTASNPELLSVAQKALGKKLSAAIDCRELVQREGKAAGVDREVWKAAVEEAIVNKGWEVAGALGKVEEPGLLEEFGSAVVGAIAQADPKRAAEWVQAQQEGTGKDRITTTLMTTWLLDDPKGASSYVLSAMQGRERQIAALSIISYLKTHGDVEGAEQWAKQIVDKDIQEHLRGGTFP